MFPNSVLLLAIGAAILATSCNKETVADRCVPVTIAAPASEVAALQAYLSQQGISAVADARGFFYIINRQGDTTNKPTICSSIKVSYTGRLTNGNQFDAGSNQVFLLGNLIPGWQEGIPLIGEGGAITLYLPPGLAYGSQGSSKIPPNSNLVFQIELVDVL